MKRVSSCIFVSRNWYWDVILFPFPLQTHWKASKEPKQDLYNDVFFAPIFSFPQEGKIRFYLCCKKHEFCFWIFFLSSYNHFLSHNDHLHSIVNFYKPFHLHPRNIVLPYIADTFKKLPKVTLKKSSLSKCAYWSNFRSINFFSSKKFATNQHEEKKKANANQSVCNIFGGEYNCISLSFQKKKCFLRWNEEWSQRIDEWQEHLEKPHCCKEKDNIFVQSFYLRLWCFFCATQSSQTFRDETYNNDFFKHQIWC